MFNLIKSRIKQGSQYIEDLRKAEVNQAFRGLPMIDETLCDNRCNNCVKICPTEAIGVKPLSIDLGKCTLCGECSFECTKNAIKLTNFHKMAVDERKKLIIDSKTTIENYYKNAVKCDNKIKSIFGRSLKLRQVSAGGCNSCEMELNACSNVNFDMGRFGIEMAASPRHADGIIITGPITENMEYALLETYLAIPEPKIVIVAGSCAISGGLFAKSDAVKREFLSKNRPALYIPGCPVHPLTVINGIMDLLGIKMEV